MIFSQHPSSGVRNRCLSSPDVSIVYQDNVECDKLKSVRRVGTEDSSGWKDDLRIVGLILSFSLAFLVCILYFYVFAPLGNDGRKSLKVPTSLQSAQELGQVLSTYATDYKNRLLLGHCLCYLFLQTFAIPGTVFFNLLGGALFGMQIGFPLCLIYNTAGSIFLNALSKSFGKRLVVHFFPKKLEGFRGVINSHRSDLTVYLIFLRIFPFTPNWFLNVSSPHLDIPLVQFASSVFIGLIPYNFLSCRAGLVLSELRSKNDIIDTTTTMQLGLLAIAGVALHSIKKKYYSSVATVPQ